MAKLALQALPPEEAVAFFRAKGFQIGFDWRDVWGEEHARAFTVAKAMRLDILADIRGAIDEALETGMTFETFRRQLTPILQSKGWWGRRQVLDPRTGELVKAQLGSPRRLRVMFDANMRSAHAAGRWERIQRVKDQRPFLRYVAVLDQRTRPEHAAWHGTVLPVDDAFWNTHSPPNGWNCRCIVQQLARADLDGEKVSARPPTPTRPFLNRRTGETSDVPVGIDPGWAHNIGAARMKGLVPPEQSGPLPVPFTGPASRVAMPPPRTFDPAKILPAGRPPEEYADAFLREFGAARGRPRLFTDAIGEPLVISDHLFKDQAGRWKILKRGRERHMAVLAAAIREPDEIWWQWHVTHAGKRVLTRRYFARFEVAGEKLPAVVMFETGAAGWTGTTAFTADTQRYLMNQRGGALAYRRAIAP